MPDNIHEAIGFITGIYNDPLTFYRLKEEQILKSSEFVRNYNYLDFANDYFETGKVPKVVV